MEVIVKINTRNSAVIEKTFEGAAAVRTTNEQKLRRSVLSCMLFEDTFYEDGQSIAERIKTLAALVPAEKVADLAVEARTKFKLRHAPLWLSLALFEAKPDGKNRLAGGRALENVIQRADELSETLAMWWKNGKRPIPNQMKKALAKAFTKFNEYSLAKYNQSNAVKLRDVLFMVHAKPQDEAQAQVWKRLVNGELATPDTWEVAQSATKGDVEQKRAEWTRLLTENKLGALALLRNLRNISEAGVDMKLVKETLKKLDVSRVFPYRFLTAVKYAPVLGAELEQKMFECVGNMEKLAGKTAILVDVSGSMNVPLSGKTETTRIEAACGLAILARELCEEAVVISFSNEAKVIPTHYRGFALAEAINKSQMHSSTMTALAVAKANALGYDRIIIITDEQSHTTVDAPKGKGYIMNVSVHTPSVGFGDWTRINGWSEAVFDFIRESERG